MEKGAKPESLVLISLTAGMDKMKIDLPEF